MGKIENDEIRKVKNEHFIRAFEYVAQCLSMTQGDLAESIGTRSAYISNFRKGLRPVPEDVIEKLIIASATRPGLQIFREYLYGNSEIMLLANVTDEEMHAAMSRRDNPDYDKMKEKAVGMPSDIPTSMMTPMEFSFFVEKAVEKATSYADKMIAILEKQVAEKNETIEMQRRRIAELESVQHFYGGDDPLKDYPFPVGVAEPNNKNKEQAHV